MKKKISKKEAGKNISEFFKEISLKKPENIKKIKRVAMKSQIKLREERKLFCKKCLTPYDNNGIKIKNGFKDIKCKNCGFVNRWKLSGFKTS